MNSTRMEGWTIRDDGDDYTLFDPFGAHAGALRLDIAEFVVRAANHYAAEMARVDAANAASEARREEDRQLQRDGIGGARIGDEVVVKTSKGPYQGVVKYLYPYVGSVHVQVTFKYRERRPAEYHHSIGQGDGLMIKADAILRNITREKEAEPA